MYRTGIGQDSHRFLEVYDPKKPLIMAGVKFDDTLSFEATSDGDVVLHAIFNGISQAMGGRSIGYYFDPNKPEQLHNDSKVYLEFILEKMFEEGYKIGNIGISLEAKIPKLEPMVKAMQKSIADICNIRAGQVGITATSGEGLTAFGRGEGIQALASVTLLKKD